MSVVSMMKMKTEGEKIIAALKEFKKCLENDIPIEAVEIEKIETPDGPMHLRHRVVITSWIEI